MAVAWSCNLSSERISNCHNGSNNNSMAKYVIEVMIIIGAGVKEVI